MSLATFLRADAIAELPTHSPVARAFVQYAKAFEMWAGGPGDIIKSTTVDDERLAPSFTPVLRVAPGATPVHDRECHDRDEDGDPCHPLYIAAPGRPGCGRHCGGTPRRSGAFL
jgi:hypothetical protein